MGLCDRYWTQTNADENDVPRSSVFVRVRFISEPVNNEHFQVASPFPPCYNMSAANDLGAGLCNGSTTDFESVCPGSNPGPAATFMLASGDGALF